jgi:carbon-monoxide dehydrogenase small subunit
MISERNPKKANQMSAHPISLTVNGQLYEGSVEPRRLLSDFLRDDLGLKGLKTSCDIGICGCCTVMLDGKTVRACLIFAIQTDGADLLTVEGLAKGPQLHPIQEAFWNSHALQCGYCTPGMLISAYELLRENDDPTEPEIRAALDGNLCRCTGYVNIVKAVRLAAQQIRNERRLLQTAPAVQNREV